MMKTLFAILILTLSMPQIGMAAGKAVKAPKQDWSFKGPTGTFDKASMQRGLKVYREVCAACHGLDRIYFRNLHALGYEDGQIKNIASQYMIVDGPDESGEMFDRPGRPSDTFPNPFPNAKAAVAANGAYPPDLSLMTKARKNGSDYLYALLLGYKDAPAGKDIPSGKHWNKYYPGHIITMANPLMDGLISYEDGSPETIEQYAWDVTNFLSWAAQPYLEDQKQTGVKVILFLLAFAGVMYAYKKRIWSDVK